jgi:hypothetical protein
MQSHKTDTLALVLFFLQLDQAEKLASHSFLFKMYEK